MLSVTFLEVTSSLCSCQENYWQVTRIWITIICLSVILSSKKRCSVKWPFWLTTQHVGTCAFPGESLGAPVCGVKCWASAPIPPTEGWKEKCAPRSRTSKIVSTVSSRTVLNGLTSSPLVWVCGRDLMSTVSSLPALCWPHEHRGKGKACLGISWKSFDFVERVLKTHRSPWSTL